MCRGRTKLTGIRLPVIAKACRCQPTWTEPSVPTENYTRAEFSVGTLDEQAPWDASLHRTRVTMGGLVMIGDIFGALALEISHHLAVS